MLVLAAGRVDYPVTLNLPSLGSITKSDCRGVLLGVSDQDAPQRAYNDLRGRLGPRVIVQTMAGEGVEMALGCVVDPDFGPLVMVSAGATFVELFRGGSSRWPPSTSVGSTDD